MTPAISTRTKSALGRHDAPVDYAVISQSLIAVACEMGVKLVRSAYSTVLREARDGAVPDKSFAG